MFVFAFVPAKRGDLEVFDVDADLHAHGAAYVRKCLHEASFEVCDVSRPARAYQNGEQGWIKHRIVIARRAEFGLA